MLSHFKAFVWNRINGNATFFNPDVVTKFDVVAIGKYADKVEVQKELKNNKITFTITSADNSDLPEVTLYTAEYDEIIVFNCTSISSSKVFAPCFFGIM